MLRCYLLLGLLLLFFHQAFSQSEVFRNLSISEGLPSSEVYEVFEDKKGFLWFTTDNGVVRFDGREMQKFHLAEGLVDPVIFGCVQDSKNRIWFRSYSGKLCYLEGDVIKKYAENEKLNKLTLNILYTIYPSEEGLWFGNGNGIGKIDNNGKVSLWKNKAGVLSIRKVDSTYLWQSSTAGIKEIQIDDKPFPVTLSPGIEYNKVLSVLQVDNNLLIAIQNNIFKYDGHSVVKVYTSKAPIISLSFDHERNLWVGYRNKGVEKLNPYSFETVDRLKFFDHLSVTKVLQDKEGGYWFSTLEKGVYHASNLSIRKYNFPAESKVTAALSTNDFIYTGDQTGILTQYDPVTKRVLTSLDLKTSILSLAQSGSNNLWISASGNTYLLDSLRHLKDMKNPFRVTSFSKDKYGHIWSAGGAFIDKYDGRHFTVLDTMPYFMRSIAIHDSLLFIARKSGFELRSLSLESVKSSKDFDDIKASGFLPINDSLVLVNTIGSGIILLNTRKMTYHQYNAHKMFIADDVFSAAKTDSTIWLSTEKGLIILNTASVIKGDFQYSLITQKSLLNEKINHILYHNPDIWAFSDDGFFVIPNRAGNTSRKNPKYYLKTITVNNTPVANPAKQNLRHFENNLALSYGFISYTSQNIII